MNIGTAEIHLKEKYQVMPNMPPEQFEALKADIAERGVLVPIDVDEHGYILDGHHRYRVCVELGITDFPTVVRPGLTEQDRRIFARKSNMLRRHLTRKQVRELIAEQLKDTPDWANNRIGQVLGADSKTVKSVRERLERTSEFPKLDKLVGADGKARPVKQSRPAAIMAANVDDLCRILGKLDEGASVDEVQGFLSEQGFEAGVMIHAPNYNPFAHCDQDGERAWHLWILFMVEWFGWKLESAAQHIEWVLQRQVKTPDEWIGEEGIEWRARVGMTPKIMDNKGLLAWEKFLAKHDGKSLEEITAMLDKLADKEKNPRPA